MKRAALWASVLLVAACGGTGPTASVTSSSPLATASQPAEPSLSPAPVGACSSSTRCLALVTLRGSESYVVRDITDINHPKTVASMGKIPNPPYPSAPAQFVSDRAISFVD